MSPMSNEDHRSGSPRIPRNRPSPFFKAIPSAIDDHDSDMTLADVEVSTVEALNIHKGDMRPLIIDIDKHINTTTRHMEDLTL